MRSNITRTTKGKALWVVLVFFVLLAGAYFAVTNVVMGRMHHRQTQLERDAKIVYGALLWASDAPLTQGLVTPDCWKQLQEASRTHGKVESFEFGAAWVPALGSWANVDVKTIRNGVAYTENLENSGRQFYGLRIYDR